MKSKIFKHQKPSYNPMMGPFTRITKKLQHDKQTRTKRLQANKRFIANRYKQHVRRCLSFFKVNKSGKLKASVLFAHLLEKGRGRFEEGDFYDEIVKPLKVRSAITGNVIVRELQVPDLNQIVNLYYKHNKNIFKENNCVCFIPTDWEKPVLAVSLDFLKVKVFRRKTVGDFLKAQGKFVK